MFYYSMNELLFITAGHHIIVFPVSGRRGGHWSDQGNRRQDSKATRHVKNGVVLFFKYCIFLSRLISKMLLNNISTMYNDKLGTYCTWYLWIFATIVKIIKKTIINTRN